MRVYLHLLLLLLPAALWAQLPASKLPVQQQYLLLKMASDFKHVTTFGTLTVDAALQYVAPIEGLTRLPVMYEGLEQYSFAAGNDWLLRGTPSTALAVLPGLRDGNHALQLLQLGIYYAFEPELHSGAADSARQYLQQALAEARQYKLAAPILLATQRMLMKVALKQYDFAQADTLLQQQVAQALPARNYAAIGAAYYYYGYYVPLPAGRMMLRAQMYARAVDYYTLAGRKEQRLEAMAALAYQQSVIQQQDSAIALLPRILKGMDSIGFRYQHYMTDLQAYIYTMQQRNQLEAQAAFRSLATAKETRDSLPVPVLLVRAGKANADLQRFSESNAMNMEALRLFVRRHDPAFYSTLPGFTPVFADSKQVDTGIALINRIVSATPPQNAVDSFRYNSTMAMLYLRKNAFSKAITYGEAAAAMEGRLKDLGLFYVLPELYFNAGMIYHDAGDYPHARIYLEKLNAMQTPQVITQDQVARMHWRLSNIYYSEQKTDLAFQHLRRYTQIEDSLNYLRSIRDAAELAVQYETARKEESIKILEASGKLQESELKRSSLIRNIILSSAFFVLLLAIYLYRLYKRNQARTRLLEKQQAQIREQNGQLNELIGEKDELLQTKELLVREIHHRVKNNLQILMSLLSTQASFLKDSEAQRAILDSHGRMQAISIVHNQLYKRDDMTVMHMREYINSLSSFLRQSFAARRRIHFDVTVEDLLLDVSLAIPLGLIVNEAVTNAIKYAFDETQWGRITIQLTQPAPDLFQLVVADDGRGLPDGFDLEQRGSMGMHLIKVLSHQLRGELVIANKDGVSIALVFSTKDS